MVQIVISLTHMNAIKLLMSVQALLFNDKMTFVHISSSLALQRHMASADNTSGPVPQSKERCMLQCALSLEEEKSSWLVPNPAHAIPYVPLTNKELELLFQPMFDEYFTPPGDRQVPTINAVQVSVNLTSLSVSISCDQDAPSGSHLTSSSDHQSSSVHHGVVAEQSFEVNLFSAADPEPFVNVFAPDSNSEASLSGVITTTKPNQSTQPHEHLRKWTDYHPNDNIIGSPSRPVSTQKQVATDALWCFYNSVLSKVEPKNFNSAVTENCWFQAMQDEIHEFDRLDVWELVPPLDCAMINSLKWIYKVKLDEYGDVLKNKACLVAKGYHQEEGPGPQLLTPRIISSGIVPQPPSPTPNVSPTKNACDSLFCPMFDEYFNPLPSVVQPVLVAVVQEPVVSTGTPSSTRIDQDTPYTSTLQTTQEEQSHVIPTSVKDDDHEPGSEESSSRIVIPTNVHLVNQPQEHIEKWTKDHPLDKIIDDPSRPVSTRLQLQTEALFCYYDALLSSSEHKSYKDAFIDLEASTSSRSSDVFYLENCADNMANRNVPSHATIRSDDQIMLFNAWMPIGKALTASADVPSSFITTTKTKSTLPPLPPPPPPLQQSTDSTRYLILIISKGLKILNPGSGYQQKDRNPSQNDKTEHGMEKTVQNQGQSPKMPKSESILKNQQSEPEARKRKNYY
ncbi:retrovirus-related pol polyprotein from transposon TNT 1-94 [Tanacetum coccineum]